MTTARIPLCPRCQSRDHFDRPAPLPQGGWQFVCREASHGVHVFEVDADYEVAPLSDELAADLGIFDDLRELITNELQRVEYGIVEHLYGTNHPGKYKELVGTYGHTALGPGAYTTSTVIAAALGRLCVRGELNAVFGPATGFWSYNPSISYWCPAGVEPPATKTWETFAVERGLDPLAWPLLVRTRAQRYWAGEFKELGPGDPTNAKPLNAERWDGRSETLLESLYNVAMNPQRDER